MLKRFDELPVGKQFVVGDCQYEKTEEHHQTWQTGLGLVRLGNVNAKHLTSAGKVVEDYFAPGNVVEVENEVI